MQRKSKKVKPKQHNQSPERGFKLPTAYYYNKYLKNFTCELLFLKSYGIV